MALVVVIWSAILLLAFQEVASFSVATVSTIWRPRYSPGFELWERSIQSGSSTLVPTFVTPESIRLCSCWWFLGLISTDLYKDCAPTFGPMSALDQCLCCCSQVMSVFHLRDFISLKIQKAFFRENTHCSVSHVALFSWLLYHWMNEAWKDVCLTAAVMMITAASPHSIELTHIHLAYNPFCFSLNHNYEQPSQAWMTFSFFWQ